MAMLVRRKSVTKEQVSECFRNLSLLGAMQKWISALPRCGTPRLQRFYA
jgi:hypothetical protein